ncbi:hypothetical protein V8E36_005859 [Tilletia maclaganii]
MDAGDGTEDELQRFRDQWKQELLSGGTSAAPSAANTLNTLLEDSSKSEAGRSDAYKSLSAYTRAVLAERRHDLNTALEAYKRAFRLHENPDKLYHRACSQLLDASVPGVEGSSAQATSEGKKGKGKAAQTRKEAAEIASLLDPALTALLRASLEPSADDDGEATSKATASAPKADPDAGSAPDAAAKLEALSTPKTSPKAVARLLAPASPTKVMTRPDQPHTYETTLPRAPLISNSATAAVATSSSSGAALSQPPADRYTSHRDTTRTLPAIQLPAVKSTNALLPLLERLVKEPRPERESKTKLPKRHSGPPASQGPLSNGTAPAEAPASSTRLVGQSPARANDKQAVTALQFQPEDEEAPCYLARLPDELLLAIALEVARPRGRRGDKIPLPVGLHSVPGAPTLGGGATAATGTAAPSSKETGKHEASLMSSSAMGAPHHDSKAVSHHPTHHHHKDHHALGLAVNLALPDVPSLEALGRTCAKWRVLTSGAASFGAGGERWGVWRLCVQATYLPPILPRYRLGITMDSRASIAGDDDLLLSALYAQHSSDWRTLYLEHPRIRLNGCYIASCRYTRAGMSEENVWISVVHVVEFFRSIRFLPDGSCLSLLSTEPPGETVRRMEPGWRRKGLCVGKWRLFPWGLPEEGENGARSAWRKRRRKERLRQTQTVGGDDTQRGSGAAGGGQGLPSAVGGPSGVSGSVAAASSDGVEDGLASDLDGLLLHDAYAADGNDTSGGAEGTDESDEDDDDDVFYEYDSDDEIYAIQHPTPPSASSGGGGKQRHRTPKVVVTDLRDRTLPKYAFRMVFALKSSLHAPPSSTAAAAGVGQHRAPSRVWNRLELERYESIHLGNGERLGLPLTHTKPFVFSVVRSYGVG